MKILRIYKEHSTKAGQQEIIDEKKMKRIYDCCDLFIDNQIVSTSGSAPLSGDFAPFEKQLKLMEEGKVVDQFFSTFRIAPDLSIEDGFGAQP